MLCDFGKTEDLQYVVFKYLSVLKEISGLKGKRQMGGYTISNKIIFKG